MEPSEAIAIVESDLRYLLSSLHADVDEALWLTAALGDASVQTLQGRLEDERGRRKPFVVPNSLLSYTHLYELRKCLNAMDWSVVAGTLGKKKEFDLLLDQVESVRNAPAHSRELLPYERSLLEGIAGTIRTRITMHRSSRAPDSKHYPVMEMVRDSFGNESPSLAPTVTTQIDTALTLQVGHVVAFELRGWDAQGRELRWNLHTGLFTSLSSATGTECTIRYTIRTEDVAQDLYLYIDMSSDGEFHRYGIMDQRVVFRYGVEPPLL